MQSHIAKWEQRNQPILCPLLASSPPPLTDFSQQAYGFLSSPSIEANFNPFSSIPLLNNFSVITSQNLFGSFTTQTASQACVFDVVSPQQQHSYVNSFLQSTIPSNTAPNSSQQLVASSLGTHGNTNLTEYLRNITTLNANSSVTNTAVELNKVLATLQPSTPTTTHLLANNARTVAQSALIAAGQETTRSLLEQAAVVVGLDPSNTNNSFIQSQPLQSISLQPNLLTATDLKSLLSNGVLQTQQQSVNEINQSNPFLISPQQQQTTPGALKLVGSPQDTPANLLDEATSTLLQKAVQQQQVSSDYSDSKGKVPLYSPQLTEALKMLRYVMF